MPDDVDILPQREPHRMNPFLDHVSFPELVNEPEQPIRTPVDSSPEEWLQLWPIHHQRKVTLQVLKLTQVFRRNFRTDVIQANSPMSSNVPTIKSASWRELTELGSGVGLENEHMRIVGPACDVQIKRFEIVLDGVVGNPIMFGS